MRISSKEIVPSSEKKVKTETYQESIKVLLVDDETAFIDTMAVYLRKKGMYVLTSYSGEAALKQLEKEEMDIIVLDIKMPGMDGLETLLRIKIDYPLTEVIILTGHATIESAIKGAKIGAFDYLRKPLKLNEFVKSIYEAKEKKMVNERMMHALTNHKLSTIETLAAGIAHEINNPLAAMVETAGLVEDMIESKRSLDKNAIEELKVYISRIKTHGFRCKQITHKLLSLTQDGAAKASFVNLNDYIEKLASFFEWEASLYNIEIVKELESDLPRINATDQELQLVLIVLINNAIEAIGNNSGKVILKTWTEENAVCLDVTDTGQGIQEDDLPRIFDPFFTTKPVGKGEGLGLFVCHGIIERMNSRIFIHSKVGTGTTFSIKFPFKGDDHH